MAKVILVKKAPKELAEKEAVIEMPDFIDQVTECRNMLGREKLTTINNMRAVVNAVGLKYDQNFNPLLHVNLSKFRDREYKSLEDFSKIIVEIFERQYPQMIDKYIEHNIKQRNTNVDTIFFVGPKEKLSIFQNFGFLVEENKGKKDSKKNDSKDSDKQENGV